MTLTVVQPGLLTTVQDLGRPALSCMGVPASGAADALSLRVGNRLVGNPESGAALEMTLVGGVFRFSASSLVCLTGADAPGAAIEASGSHPLPAWTPTQIPAGATVRIGPLAGGARAYLCIAGGIDTPPVLSSRSTLLGAALGGHEGRPLRAGDCLPLGAAPGEALPPPDDSVLHRIRRMLDERTLRVTPGAHFERFSPGAREGLASALYTVAEQSDRMGVRLRGPALESPAGGRLLSEPTITGAIQVPPSGEPIALLVDRPPTGGYPVIACVIEADLPALAQRRPRDEVRFRWVPRDEALRADRAQRELIGAVHGQGVAEGSADDAR